MVTAAPSLTPAIVTWQRQPIGSSAVPGPMLMDGATLATRRAGQLVTERRRGAMERQQATAGGCVPPAPLRPPMVTELPGTVRERRAVVAVGPDMGIRRAPPMAEPPTAMPPAM